MENFEEIIRRIDSDKNDKVKNNIRKYLQKWYWFAISILSGLAISLYVFTHSPNTYEVKSRILVEVPNEEMNSILSFDNKSISATNSNVNVENKIGILKSYTLFKKALINLNWTTSWYHKKLLNTKELYLNEPFELVVPFNTINTEDTPIEIVALNENEYKVSAEVASIQQGDGKIIEINEIVKFGEPFLNQFFNFTLEKGYGSIGESYYLVFNNSNTITNNYLKKTKISGDEAGSNLITITIVGTIIQKEADFINELNNVFIQFGVENKNISSDNSLEFIESQLARISSKLESAEENFSSYRQNNQVMNLSHEAQVIYEKLESVENERYMIQLQVNYYRELQEYLDDSEKISEMVNPSVIGITDVNLNNMLTSLMELYSRRELLSYSVKEKSPSFKIIEKEITIARDALRETIKNQLKATESMLESANSRYQSIESRIKQLPKTEKDLIGIQREFDLNNELYTYLMQKKAEASISKASIAPEVKVIDPALAESSKQLGPNLAKHLGAGLAGGFFIPFLIFTFVSVFNSKIETREEIERESKLPVLEGIVKHGYKTKLPVLIHPRSGISESFRGLKSNINALLQEPGTKVISINSLIPGEGKSFIAACLSVILTKSENEVLLIDADMHKPTLHSILDVKKSIGLSDYLKHENRLEEINLSTSIPNLYFLQAGSVCENPSDLLDSSQFENLINGVREIYDYIIIDNAPLLLVPDAILTSNFSNISLFVLRLNHSHKDEIKQINKIVDFNRIKHAAIVTNCTPDRGYGYGKKYWEKGYGAYRQKTYAG